MKSSKEYLRQIGISEEKFNMLLVKLTDEIDKDRQENSLSRRGIKSKVLTIELKLLLTLTYLRHYPTFASLGDMFGISESYANKIFHKIINYMIKFIHPKKINEEVNALVVDVTEQEIEKPIKKQKSYYSGKKNAIL